MLNKPEGHQVKWKKGFNRLFVVVAFSWVVIDHLKT